MPYHLTFSLVLPNCSAAGLKWSRLRSCLPLLKPLWHIEQRRFPCSCGEGRRASPNLVPWKWAKISIGVIQISIGLECGLWADQTVWRTEPSPVHVLHSPTVTARGAGLAVSTLSGKLIVLKPLLSHPQVRGSIE